MEVQWSTNGSQWEKSHERKECIMLNGKTAVITGSTRGIGLSIAIKFLENGANVVICGSKQESVDKALCKLKERFPAQKLMGICPNLSDYNSIENAFNEVKDHFGAIDILVNNAGMASYSSIFTMDVGEFTKIIDLNVNAVFYCSRAAAIIMRERQQGVILNTSSMVSFHGQPSGCGYPASKFAVNGLTKSLARELAPHGIRVNAVAPGVTNTDMFANLPEDMKERTVKTIPLGRAGEADDVAEAFLFLASDRASYISGAVLSVDGLARS